MSERTGERTEQPTPRRLEEALKHGRIAHSPEVQTAFVLLGGVAALAFAGSEMWRQLVGSLGVSLGHLHDTPLNAGALQAYAVAGTLVLLKCLGPVLIATCLAGLIAGGIQNRFHTASEALAPDWNRLNPFQGLRRMFSAHLAASTAVSVAKLAVILLLTCTEVVRILQDPIFTTSVGVARITAFLAETSMRLFVRISLVMVVIAAADYGYQWWRHQRELMMTREELKEELKHTEADPLIKAARRRRRAVSRRNLLADVPTADVVVTSTARIAIALRYHRQTMRAPRVVARGIRLNAERIREVARHHHVPVVENPSLARMLFRHARVGGEVPASLYAAVAELLAWVYRVNRYRYYAEQNQV
jgi:flagellar biosynthetic protein FlhB